jgi:hypothetical protein
MGFCDELQEISNERKASVTHTKDFFGKKKMAQSDIEDKIFFNQQI